jgi:hypothetical protein
VSEGPPTRGRWLLDVDAFAAVTAEVPPGALPDPFRVESSGGGGRGPGDSPAAASRVPMAAGTGSDDAGVREAVAVHAAPDAAVSLRARYGAVEVLAEVAVRGAAASTLLRARRPGEDGGRVEVALTGAQEAVAEVTRALGLLGDVPGQPGRHPVRVPAGAGLAVAGVAVAGAPGDDVPAPVGDLVRGPVGTLQLWAFARGARESAWVEVWLAGRAGWWRVSPDGPAGGVLLSPVGRDGLAADLRAWWTAALTGPGGRG